MSLDLEQRYAAIRAGCTDHVCTGNTAFRKQALLDAGLFDESIGYGGDNDMSYRLTGAGWTLGHCAQAAQPPSWRDGLAVTGASNMDSDTAGSTWCSGIHAA
jgi:cellulose synthase/poly-beta-1,6-N-acetylglucosamine synthase-like glycosyltransferase